MDTQDDQNIFNAAAQSVVELGNRLADDDTETSLWDIADGILAGAIQYWLYSRQPCDDPQCEECAEVNTAAQRLSLLLQETRTFAEESDYFHTPNDSDVGRA